jgi:hypothetical protein
MNQARPPPTDSIAARAEAFAASCILVYDVNSRRRRIVCLSCDAAFHKKLQPSRYRTRNFSAGTLVTLLQARHPRQCNIADFPASDWSNQITIVNQRGSATCCKTMMTKIEKEEGNSHESLDDFQRSVAGTNATSGNKCIGSYQEFAK